jgi:TPR repeat protein
MLGVVLLLFTVGNVSAVPPPPTAYQDVVELPSGKAVQSTLTPQEMEQRAFDYFYGTGRRQNLKKAIEWFERAAAADQPVSQFRLAWFYWDGTELPKDEARALELFHAAANQGVSAAQSFLAWLYFTGTPSVPVDEAQGLRWALAAARQGDTYALLGLSRYYVRNADTSDPQRSKRLLLRAAELNDNTARRYAYSVLTKGPAELRDPQLGLYFLTRGAEANDGQCTYLLALEYLFGLNVPRDPALAAQWMERSMRGQHHEAALWLSHLYLKGIGVSRDARRSAQLLAGALKVASLQEKNSVAWELSVSPHDELRDGAMAVKILEPALAASEKKPSAYVDTLAAAYAEMGQFDQAVKAQQDAIDIERAARPKSDVSQFEERLALYRRHEPYREVPR